MRYLLATVLAVLTLASPAFASGVSNVTVNHNVPSNATGARTIYVLGFTTSASGALAPTDRIRVTFPIGTGFGGWAGGVVRDVAAGEDVGNCSNPSNSVVECSLFSGRAIAGSREVRVTFNGVNNAGNFDQHRLTVATTPDADVVNSPFFTIVPAGQLSQITLANAVPSAAAGARTRYVVEFRTSATGGLSAQANSRFDVTFPPLTGYLGWAGGVVHDVTRGVDVGNCANPSNATVQCSLFTGQFVNAGDTVRITLNGITNSTDPGTDKIVRVDTTSDWALLPSAPFTVVAADRVSAVTLSNADPSNAAGARTRYVADFTASATGGLSQAANSRIDVTFPTGTTFAGWAGAAVRDFTRGVDVGNCSNPSGLTVQCALFTGQFVNAGDALRLTFDGITNGPAGANKTVAVSTTSDPQAVMSAPFSIVFAGGLTGVTVANGVPSAAAAARTRYIVGFTTSATGGLSQDANSRIDVTFPAGTSFTGWAGATVSTGGVDVGNCSNAAGVAVQCGLFSGRVIAPGAAVTITFGGVTNGPAGADKTVSVSTTSDPTPATSAPFSVVAGGTLSAVSVAVGSLAASARTDYLVRATLSGTGGLAQDANSRIDVTLPAGTSFTGWGGGSVHDVTRAITVGNCSSPVGLVIQCALFSGRTVAAGALLQVTFDDVTNPASAGPHQLTVSTTSDTPAATSSNYTQGDTTAPDTTIDSGPSGTTADATPEFTFSSSEPGGTFECRVDGAAFAACTTPHTTATLANGPHTFEVRAMDVAGNPDQTPASRTFTVAATAPAAPVILSPAQNALLMASTVVISGTSDGTEVEVLEGATRVGTSGVSGTGTWQVTLAPVTDGTHTYTVRASNPAGTGPDATRTIRVDTGIPDTTITSGPSGLTNDATPTFTFASPEAPVTFECQVNGAFFAACPSPHTLELADGTYTLSARAVDAAGNRDNTPATRTFTIETVPPAAPAIASPAEGARFESGTVTLSGSAEAGSTVTVREDGALRGTAAGPNWAVTLEGIGDGEHVYEVRATDAAGNASAAATRRIVVARAQQATTTPTAATASATPTPAPTATPTPTPTFRDEVVVAPVSGTIKVCPKGPTGACTTLPAGDAIPIGSTVDARKGVVELTSLSAPGAAPQKARFSEGMFQVKQVGSITELTLNEPLDCRKQARTSQKKPKSRKLWGDGKGKFRTKGSYAAATVRGTKWLVQDTCTTTLVRVTQGVVSVRDSVKDKTITLRAGQRYTARARR